MHKTPSFATVAAGIGAAVFYSVLTFVSERVLTDTIYSLGIMICFYYGLTAFGCIWFFRRELFQDFSSFVFKLLFPLLGGLGLTWVFVVTLRDSASPDYGSGAAIGGVGLVLILGLGLIILGIVFMLIQRAKDPAYFRGETLVQGHPGAGRRRGLTLLSRRPVRTGRPTSPVVRRAGPGRRARTPPGSGGCRCSCSTS